MSISDATGNIVHNVDKISEIVGNAKASISQRIGSMDVDTMSQALNNSGVNGAAAGMFGRSFVGMNADRIGDFDAAIEKHKNEVEAIIGTINEKADLEHALKGEVASATRTFLEAVKQLLQSYVSTINLEKEHIKEANANYLAATKEISGDIETDSDEIRSRAGEIDIS